MALLRMCSIFAGVSLSGVMSPPITSSERKPSSVISSTRVVGVHSELTVRRSMPGRNITACVTSDSLRRKAAFHMSPLFARTATMMRFAPNTWSRYWWNVWTYSWFCGSCFSKPADIRSCPANTPMSAVNAASVASVATRCVNSAPSRRATRRASMGARGGLASSARRRQAAGRRLRSERVRKRDREVVAVAQQVVAGPAGEARVGERSAPLVQILEVERRRDGQAALDERDRVRADAADVVGDVDLRRHVDRAPEDVRVDDGQLADEPRRPLGGQLVVRQQVWIDAREIEIRVVRARHLQQEGAFRRVQSLQQPPEVAARPEQVDRRQVRLPFLLVDVAGVRARRAERAIGP